MKVSELCRVTSWLVLVSIVACGDNDKVPAVDSGRAIAGDGGVDASEPASPECPTISFVSPAPDATLNEGDDKDQDACQNGFQFDVSVATSASDGTDAALFAGSTKLGDGTVDGALVKFEGVQLAANAEATLTVQVGGTKCLATQQVTVSCNVPTCDLTKPVVSASHPKLNGVPVANGGDRVSAGGSPYQVLVEVTTSVEDGQPVQLSVDDSDVLLTATARGGSASFPGVTLAPDGEHAIIATCSSKSSIVGTSARAIYEVDTESPELTISEPANGAHFEEVTSFSVCGTTTSEDAWDLPSDTGETGGSNLCAAIGGSSPACEPVAAEGSGGKGCVDVECPGGPAFDVTLALRDAAGNVTTKVLSGITCRTELPSVDIVSPTSTVTGDPSTYVLAANATQARKDADAAMPGAQFTVVACSEVEGGQVQLRTGPAGGALTDLGEPVATEPATTQDGCPANKPYAARFVNATLPESSESATGALLTATRLVAAITDESETTGTSPPVDVWVDSVVPTLSAALPVPLCGYFRQGTTDWTTEVRLNSSVLPVTMTVRRPDGAEETHTATTYAAGVVASFGMFTFGVGDNQVSATTTEPSGNTNSLPTPCVVSVGNPPIVTWVAPTATSKLDAASDLAAAEGWQGSLTVHTDLAGVTPTPTVQFSTTPGGNLGAPVPVDSNGDATLSSATIPEGAAVMITATTSEVVERGIGRATITVPVDTSSPDAIGGLTVTIPPDKRRQTTFHLAWTAPADGGAAVTGYDVRVATTAITDPASFNAAERVTYVGMPAQPGQSDGIDVANRYIERDYYFAVVSIDVAGNRGAIVSAGPHRARFNRTILEGGDGEAYGRSIDGAQSVNGDAFADLIVGVGTGSAAYIYFGAAGGFASTPSVTISGPTGVQFGYAAQLIGDIDGDGLTDLAVGAPVEGAGTTYIFKGRISWPASLSHLAADYTVVATDARFANAFLGSAFARLGDFDGDGADDFALSGYKYSDFEGFTAVIRGVPAGQTFPATVTLGAGSALAIEAPAPDNQVERFGWALTSLGAFYGGTTSVLVSTGHYYGDTATPVENHRYGAAYAFGSGSLNVAAPADSVVGAADNQYLGWSIAPLGALGSPMAVAVGIPAYTVTGGSVAIHVGNTSTGPFVADPIVLTNAAASAVGDGFGCVFGSVIAGVSASTLDNKSSFIGSSLPDVAISGLAENGAPAKLYLIDGQKVATTLTSGDIATAADVTVPLPEDWTGGLGCMPRSGAIRDLNDDGYADIAIGQYLRIGTYTGQVVVLW